MSIKLGSIVTVLMMFFIAKISFETAIDTKVADRVHDRSQRLKLPLMPSNTIPHHYTLS